MPVIDQCKESTTEFEGELVIDRWQMKGQNKTLVNEHQWFGLTSLKAYTDRKYHPEGAVGVYY